MGNVVSANVGQAPARQAAKAAGLPDATVATTVNKVCASGMKSIMYAAQSVALGHHDAVVAGGMESMTGAPYYVPTGRYGARYGHGALVDGLLRDGLWDPYADIHMGMCAEETATKLGISRAAQDAYAVESYKRAKAAHDAGAFKAEIVGVPVKGKGGETLVTADEEYTKMDLAKIPTLRAAFKPKDGTITAGNASKLNDGASALVIMAADAAKARGLKPLARIRGYADAEQAPIDFPTAPAKAVPVALKRAGVAPGDVAYHEINEAFAVVVLANAQLLGLDLARVNVFGGAVALGHPIGSSGARIVATLLSVLRAKDAAIGVASICNGGGGGSAVVIERLA
jgi:acetyl-CoA C-acetyltransferase